MPQRKRRNNSSWDDLDRADEESPMEGEEVDAYGFTEPDHEPPSPHEGDVSNGRVSDEREKSMPESRHAGRSKKNAAEGRPAELGATESFEATTSSSEDPAGTAQPKSSTNAEPTEEAPPGYSPPNELSKAYTELQGALATGEYALVLQALEVLTDLANRGSLDAARIVRATLDENPSIWKTLGDLGDRAETALIHSIHRKSPLAVEATKRHIAAMRSELLTADVTTLEKMAVQRVIMAWLMTQVTDIHSAVDIQSSHTNAWGKRQELAEKCYDHALKSLQLTREMARTTKVPAATAAQPVPSKAKPTKPK